MTAVIDQPYVSPSDSLENRMAIASGRHNGGIAGIFVFVLLGLFALMSTLMVLLGAQLYHGTVQHSAVSSEERVLSSYVRTMVRAMDAADCVAVEEEALPDGGTLPVLSFREEFDGDAYVTQLYLWEGSLRELFTDASFDFEPEDGEVIASATRFEPSLTGGLLTIGLGTETGEETLRIALRTAQP